MWICTSCVVKVASVAWVRFGLGLGFGLGFGLGLGFGFGFGYGFWFWFGLGLGLGFARTQRPGARRLLPHAPTCFL